MQATEFQGLHNLVAPWGARKNRKRLGRGESSGHGKTSGRGHKGQKARKSGNVRIGFEGGQNPMDRRVPKRGFSNAPFKKDVQAVNISRMSAHFVSGSTVDISALIAAGLIRSTKAKVKLLGNGDLAMPLNFLVHSVSQAALQKVKQAGGDVKLIGKE